MSNGPARPSPLWRGDLIIRGNHTQLRIHAIAHAFKLPDTPPLTSSTAWPPQLHCHTTQLRTHSAVCEHLYAERTKWYAQFVPVDAHGVEVKQHTFDGMVRVLVQRNMVFRVACGEGGGVLYLLGMEVEREGVCLLGVHWEGDCGEGGRRCRNVESGSVGAAGRRVWEGLLHVRGNRLDMKLSCMAVQDGGGVLVDGSGWPERIVCDADALRVDESLVDEMNAAQWYVRFVVVDGRESAQAGGKLVTLVRGLEERGLVFEVRCEGGVEGGTSGVLYIWGLNIPPHGFSLVGVFKPDLVEGGREGQGERGETSMT